jgi:hypothetical protein
MTDFDGEILEWIQVAKGDKCPLCKGTGKIRDGHMTCPKCGGKKVAKDANESLATIMRHDKGHDDWHASHGDPPCKDEADCERMSAKYAEVKAEQGVTKGDTPGHAFHGNQYTGGNAGAHFDSFRPLDPNQTIAQIGKMNILGISGGRVNALRNSHGEAVGVQLPVGHGYGVNVLLHPNDTYTVQRTYTRSGTTTIKGQEEGVYADQVGDTAYRAGMYVNVPFGAHNP